MSKSVNDEHDYSLAVVEADGADEQLLNNVFDLLKLRAQLVKPWA